MTTKNYATMEKKSNEATIEKVTLTEDTVRMNSTAVIKDKATGKVFSFTIVLPEQADIKQNKVSTLAPAGNALMGLRKGQDVSWKTPAGMKHFHIVEVRQPEVV